VLEIYMQEFWATATVHHHSIRFKVNNKKHIVNLEYFREMLYICLRILNQTFDELPFEEEILAFLRYLGHNGEFKKINDDPLIPRRNKVNWHYVRDDQMFTTIKLVSRHHNTQQFGAMLPVKLTNEDIRNSAAYKEYYAIASGAAPPKTKASMRKTQSSFDTTMPPPTAAGTGIIPGVPDVPTDESDEEISWKSSDKDDDDDQDDNDDDQDSNNDDDDFIHPKLSTCDEEAKDEESFDPIVQTPSQLKNSDDESNDDDESHGMNVGGEEGSDAEDDNEELYRDVNINLEGRDVQMTDTSYAVAADLSELELKKILIEKMKSNKSIYRSDEQRNLYKALVDAYECDKIILDTYKDTVTLKIHPDDADKDKEPSDGSDRGSKRKREGKEPESTSAPKEKASKTIGAADDPPIAEASQHPECDLAKQADSHASFNELMDTPIDFSAFMMNRLDIDTLTLELLAGPTYELMKGSCKSLDSSVALIAFADADHASCQDTHRSTSGNWNNPKGQQYPHNLLKPLPLIPNSQGRRVIPFDHFIKNDLEYLRGGASSRKYTISVTKTKAVDYGHIK
nr:hypothetical protein [Tanacetum cinerariifolium]